MNNVLLRNKNLINQLRNMIDISKGVRSLDARRTLSIAFDSTVYNLNFRANFEGNNGSASPLEVYQAGSDEIFICERIDSWRLSPVTADRLDRNAIDNIVSQSWGRDASEIIVDLGNPEELVTAIEGKKSWDLYSEVERYIRGHADDVKKTKVYKTIRDTLEEVYNTTVPIHRNPRVYPKVKDMNLYPVMRIFQEDDDLKIKYFHESPYIRTYNSNDKMIPASSVRTISSFEASEKYYRDEIKLSFEHTLFLTWSVIDDSYKLDHLRTVQIS